MSEVLAPPRRGGFWRHALALATDAVIAALVVYVLGVSLSLMTDGRVRVSDAYFSATDCVKLERPYEGISLPHDFRPTWSGRCTTSIFGYSYDWFLLMQERTESGPYHIERSVTFPLDRRDNLTRAFYLDGLILVLAGVVIFMQESKSGQTSGKRSAGLRVQSLGGGAPSRKQIAIRMLRFSFVVPILFAYVLSLAIFILGPSSGAIYSYVFHAWAIGGVLMLLTLANFTWTCLRRSLPFYDPLAGTEVVRVSKLAVPAIVSEASGGPVPLR